MYVLDQCISLNFNARHPCSFLDHATYYIGQSDILSEIATTDLISNLWRMLFVSYKTTLERFSS